MVPRPQSQCRGEVCQCTDEEPGKVLETSEWPHAELFYFAGVYDTCISGHRREDQLHGPKRVKLVVGGADSQ